MKQVLVCLLLFIGSYSFSQLENLNLTNCVVVGQFDKPEDRFTVESTLSSILKTHGVNTTPSLNYVKVGEDATVLVSDSIQSILAEKGFDTYVIASVRGYDRKYKSKLTEESFETCLGQGTLREIYRSAAVSVTFEFAFFRNGKMLAIDQIKCSNISDRETTMKRFVNKIEKRISRHWK